ncbi:MAG: hypothetical protein LBC61_03085 [Candidatus Peribacteria bacterium]|nr:hypothetical protein [Candidatus Peribacteria bacterium]
MKPKLCSSTSSALPTTSIDSFIVQILAVYVTSVNQEFSSEFQIQKILL